MPEIQQSAKRIPQPRFNVVYREVETGQDIEFEIVAHSATEAAFKAGLELGKELGTLNEPDKQPEFIEVRQIFK
jgi:hypothetical protein